MQTMWATNRSEESQTKTVRKESRKRMQGRKLENDGGKSPHKEVLE